MNDNQSLLSLPKAALALGVSAHLIRKAIAKDQIRSVEFGDRHMIPASEIERLKAEWSAVTT